MKDELGKHVKCCESRPQCCTARVFRLRLIPHVPSGPSWLKYGIIPTVPCTFKVVHWFCILLQLMACGYFFLFASTFLCCGALRCTRRRMLRWMIRPAHAESKDWQEYIGHTTCTCEELASPSASRKRDLAAKWALGMDPRWSCRLLHWRPLFRCAQYGNVG